MTIPRILHLVDPAWPGGGPPMLRLASLAAARLTSCRHEVIVLGGRRERATARRCGLAPVGSVPIPAGAAPFSLAAIRRAVRAASEGFGYRIVHAWSGRAAIAAAAVDVDHRVISLDRGALMGLQHAMLLMHLASEDVTVLATGRAAASELLADGVPRAALRMLPPAVDAPSSAESDASVASDAAASDDVGARPERFNVTPHRLELRHRWGVGRDGFVMGLLGAPPDDPDVRHACFVLALLRAAERDVHLVVHPATPGLETMLRWARAPGLRRALAGRVVLDARIAEPWRLAAGLDVGLALGEPALGFERRAPGSLVAPWLAGGCPRHRPPAVWPSIWLGHAGVPTIAEATAQAVEYVDEGRTGLLVARGDYAAAAHRVMRLCDEPQQRRRLGTAAREVVRRRNDPSSFAVRLKCVYDALLQGRRIPDPLPGLEADDAETSLRVFGNAVS